MTVRIITLMFLEADFMVRKDRVKIRWREPFFLEFVATPRAESWPGSINFACTAKMAPALSLTERSALRDANLTLVSIQEVSHRRF